MIRIDAGDGDGLHYSARLRGEGSTEELPVSQIFIEIKVHGFDLAVPIILDSHIQAEVCVFIRHLRTPLGKSGNGKGAALGGCG